ncbi:MAG: hypothetical protein K8I00_12815 [Candidatus Omnitrophica bacterium]|nr:hypothetical protein [Candidatus Omnitrophota bacterium]
MVFDAEIFERYIAKREKSAQRVSVFIRIGYHLFRNKIFLAFIGVFETVLGIILTLPIPVYAPLINGFISQLPGSPFFMGVYLRGIYWRRKLKHLGKNVVIEEGVKITSPEYIEIHDNTMIDKGAILQAGKPKQYDHQRILKGGEIVDEGLLVIGKNVVIASYATIGAYGGIKIGDGTGIGAQTNVYSFVHMSMKPHYSYEVSMTIGKDVLIGGQSSIICVKDIPDQTIIKPNTYLNESFLKKAGQE